MPQFLFLTELPEGSRSVPGALQEAMDSFWVGSSSGARGVWDLWPFLLLGAGWGGRSPCSVGRGCQGGKVGCNLGKNIDIAADVIHPVSTAGFGEPPGTVQAEENVLGSRAITRHPLMSKSNLVPQNCLPQVGWSWGCS